MAELIPIPEAQLEEAGAMMAVAFADDPLGQWIMPDSARRPALLKEMFTLTCLTRLALDQILLGIEDEGQILGVICAGDPDSDHWPDELRFKWAEFDGHLGWESASRFNRYAEEANTFRPKRPHLYVHALAVHPEAQGCGFGRRLLDAVQERAESDASYAGVGLDTGKGSNVGFYQNAGFELMGQVDLGGAEVWFLFRPCEIKS